ncbi:MAG: hypothetical protein U0587_08705 [Candidatus Binatia bacterium]
MYARPDIVAAERLPGSPTAAFGDGALPGEETQDASTSTSSTGRGNGAPWWNHIVPHPFIARTVSTGEDFVQRFGVT